MGKKKEEGTEDNDAEWVMEEYNWAAAAEFADSAGAQIISSSLGYNTFDNGVGSNTYADLNGNKTIATMAANRAAPISNLILLSHPLFPRGKASHANSGSGYPCRASWPRL